MPLVNYNGDLLEAQNVAISSDNRSFRYGDGLFESLRMIHGQFPFITDHLERLHAGMALLQFPHPQQYDQAWLLAQIKKLRAAQDNFQHGRARLMVFRQSQGYYAPMGAQTTGFLLELSPMDTPQFRPQPEGIQAGIFQGATKNTDALANFKTNNSLPYILASIHAQQQGWDDALLLNHKGNIAEATSSNLFLVKGGKVLTPALSEGCVAGVMRKQVIQVVQQQGIPLEETSITSSQLQTADEMLLTNGVQGIQWVRQLEGKTYTNTLSMELSTHLNDYALGKIKP